MDQLGGGLGVSINQKYTQRPRCEKLMSEQMRSKSEWEGKYQCKYLVQIHIAIHPLLYIAL